MNQLSIQNLSSIPAAPGLHKPTEAMLNLPETVLQFGTGVLLRGLTDYFIDKANHQGVFNGRIVVVKSTAGSGADAFDTQNGLYTLCIKGIQDGSEHQETYINSSISRVISARTHWDDILQVASSPHLKLVISNTTEVGIALKEDDKITHTPPESFPAKLTAVLYERYKMLGGTPESGLVIVPTELIIDNGKKLQEIVLKLAELNGLDAGFIDWVKTANHFCNSLVDRIVPGRLPQALEAAEQQKLGYTDDLMILAETFRLWAIETHSPVAKQVLSFAQVDDGVVIAPNIEKFRELKLRLLNGTHTFSCGVCFLAGFHTVKEALANEKAANYIRTLAMNDMAQALADNLISLEEAHEFAAKVLDRFRNPFLEHQWLAITMQYTGKMKMRNLPMLQKHYQKSSQAPQLMAKGFAGYILFMKGTQEADGAYYGRLNGEPYKITDDSAAILAQAWQGATPAQAADAVLANTTLWGQDLHAYPGFADAVKQHLQAFIDQGVYNCL